MQMYHVCRACLLVQVVNILRNNRNLIFLLKLVYKAVALIRLCLSVLMALHIIESGDDCWILKPTLMRCYLIYGIILPQSIIATECLETRLNGHAGAG